MSDENLFIIEGGVRDNGNINGQANDNSKVSTKEERKKGPLFFTNVANVPETGSNDANTNPLLGTVKTKNERDFSNKENAKTGDKNQDDINRGPLFFNNVANIPESGQSNIDNKFSTADRDGKMPIRNVNLNGKGPKREQENKLG